ncbi:MAG: hypothetical protein DCC44_06570 [Acidobacteria bacterium]|nr:MAG: hypothetical protein DCC44_06570 [Acidobacteriota bacterium]
MLGRTPAKKADGYFNMPANADKGRAAGNTEKFLTSIRIGRKPEIWEHDKYTKWRYEMGRKALAIITAMIAAVGIIWIAYMIATIIPPTPPVNLEYAREGDMAAYMKTYPTLAFVAVAIGYAIAAFAGGFIATKMGRRWSQGATLALVVGALLSVGSIATATVWPQPVWFVIVSLVIFVPLSLVGFKFADHII